MVAMDFWLGFNSSNNRPFAPLTWMPLILILFSPFSLKLLLLILLTLIINLNRLGWSISNELYVILKLRLWSFKIYQKVKTHFCQLFVGSELGGHIYGTINRPQTFMKFLGYNQNFENILTYILQSQFHCQQQNWDLILSWNQYNFQFN